jgi:pimeloyl-ACP methyl ester carboxylesterase
VPTVVVRYPDRPLDYAEHTSFARAMLPRDRPYVVLGESFSGPVAISLAATAPPGMIGYVLCASFVRCPRMILRVVRPLLGLFPPRAVPPAIAAHFLMGRHATEALRIIADALRYWEPRRLVYNGILAAIVIGCLAFSWPVPRQALTLDLALILFVLAVLANVCYCAAYVVDVALQFSSFRELALFAGTLTYFFSMSMFSPGYHD